jgi:serine protease AprX
VALFLPALTENVASAATYYVATSGDDANSCATAQDISSPKLTIASGLTCMSAGDTLLIRGGTYIERIHSGFNTIPTGTSWSNAPIIAGYPGETATLRPGTGFEVIGLAASHIQYVIFKNLHLDATGVNFGIETGNGANHIRFQNVEVFNATMSGVLTVYGTQVAPANTYHEFLSCHIHHNGSSRFDHGLYIGTSSNLIQGCSIHDNAGWGVHIFGDRAVNNNTVRDSESYNNSAKDTSSAGIVLSSGANNVAFNNTVRGNKNGIEVGFNSPSNAKVYNNTVYNNTPGVGILIQSDATNTTVANNIVWANGETILNRGTSTVLQTNLTTDPSGVGQLGGLILLPGSPPAVIDPVLADIIQTASPGQLIEAVVTFDHSPTAADLAAVEATGVQVLRFQVLPMVGVRGTAAQVSAIATFRGVRSMYANRALTYFLNESVPLIGANRVWNELGYTGRGVTVAVIDTGIDATHLDLPFGDKVIQNVKVEPDLFGSNPRVVEGLTNTDTSSGHGTHVSSTAAGTGAALGGKYRGVAIGANLVGVGVGQTVTVLAALEGFDWVLRNQKQYGIRVISNSWGTSGAFSPDDPINVASKLAHDLGFVVVFPAGNAGPTSNTLSPYCVAQWVICVAAGAKDGLTLADFSSRGIPGDSLYRPTITAPGVDIAAARATTGIVTSTFFAVDQVNLGTDADWYVAASGTSMATPHVSGTVALMLEANPALTPDQYKAILLATATPMTGYAQHEVGAGYLNAHEAVRTASQVITTSRIEETNPAISFTGSWVSRGADIATFSGGTAASSDAPGATVSLTFTGTAVRWIGLRCEVCGIARVLLDGVETNVDTFAPTLEPASSLVASASGLSNGSHTLVIEVTGTGNPGSGGAHIVVDAFDVDSDDTAPPPTRFEESAATLSPADAWGAQGPDIATFSDSTAVSSIVAEATATFPFTGTGVSWIGLKCNVCGIAFVSIDGGAATTVDTAGPAAPGTPGLTSEVLFTTAPLVAGSHAMVIRVTGTTSSGGAHIVMDAFDVTSDGTVPPPSPAPTRYESEGAATLTGTWTSNTDFVAWSGGSAAASNVGASRATISFTGTAVSWVGVKCELCGIADVFVDGTLAGTVDLFSPTREQGAVFTATGLLAGSHTLAIEVTGTTNPASGDAYVAVDAFDVSF